MTSHIMKIASANHIHTMEALRRRFSCSGIIYMGVKNVDSTTGFSTCFCIFIQLTMLRYSNHLLISDGVVFDVGDPRLSLFSPCSFSSYGCQSQPLSITYDVLHIAMPLVCVLWLCVLMVSSVLNSRCIHRTYAYGISLTSTVKPYPYSCSVHRAFDTPFFSHQDAPPNICPPHRRVIASNRYTCYGITTGHDPPR